MKKLNFHNGDSAYFMSVQKCLVDTNILIYTFLTLGK